MSESETQQNLCVCVCVCVFRNRNNTCHIPHKRCVFTHWYLSLSVYQANIFLRSLDLSYNGLGREGAVSLGEALKDNNTLEELDIRYLWDGHWYKDVCCFLWFWCYGQCLYICASLMVCRSCKFTNVTREIIPGFFDILGVFSIKQLVCASISHSTSTVRCDCNLQTVWIESTFSSIFCLMS